MEIKIKADKMKNEENFTKKPPNSFKGYMSLFNHHVLLI